MPARLHTPQVLEAPRTPQLPARSPPSLLHPQPRAQPRPSVPRPSAPCPASPRPRARSASRSDRWCTAMAAKLTMRVLLLFVLTGSGRWRGWERSSGDDPRPAPRAVGRGGKRVGRGERDEEPGWGELRRVPAGNAASLPAGLLLRPEAAASIPVSEPCPLLRPRSSLCQQCACPGAAALLSRGAGVCVPICHLPVCGCPSCVGPHLCLSSPAGMRQIQPFAWMSEGLQPSLWD